MKIVSSLPTLSKINNPDRERPMVLIAPLDWGLGHATRCIPIIKELLNQKCEPWIAASGDQKALLQREFPFLPFVELPGYGIKYGKNRAFTIFKIIAAIPKILTRIKEENRWLQQFLIRERPDIVISDNRYGLYAPGIHTVFITHQLRISSSFGRVADALLQRLNYRLIDRFSTCWVPDLEEGGGLSGNLSHPGKLPHVPTRYIGVLSRFGGDGPPGEPCDLLILLSGPEPQRTLFERQVLEQLPSYSGRATLVRGLPRGGPSPGSREAGLPGVAAPGMATPGLTIYDHLPAGALEKVMRGAGLILARAGYSTVMDLARLGKKAILVPTPGQAEQEYLGAYLAGKRLAVCIGQREFSLAGALEAAANFPFMAMTGGDGVLLRNAIKDLLSQAALTT